MNRQTDGIEVIRPARELKDPAAKKESEPGLAIRFPEITLDQKLPEKPKVKQEKKPKGKPGRPSKKPKIELPDIKVPLGMLVLTITEAIAESKKDPRYIASVKETKAIEDAFNQWVDYRFEILKKFAPEIALALPIISYVWRVSRLPPLEKK